MTSVEAAPGEARSEATGAGGTPRFTTFLAIVALLTVVRLVGLGFSVVDLYFDESQYWSWSRDLAFGYFSKPPLIAWIIAAAESVCGPAEACVRAPAPLLYFGTALLVYVIGRELYGPRVAFLAGLVMALMPGLVFSARIMSTDVPLLFFWSLALLAWLKLAGGGSRWWALVLAVAFGLGLLAKYAMIYFVPSAIVAGLVDPRARRLAADPMMWLAFAGGAGFLVPNLQWNLANGMATFGATGEDISGRGVVFDVTHALEFFASQFAVGGPIVFGALIVMTARLRSASITANDRVMLSFSVPILAVLTVLGLITSANPNWGAAAYIAAGLATTAWLARIRRTSLVVASVAIGAFCQVVLLTADPFADRLSVPLLNRADVYAQTMGWQALGENVAHVADKTGARAIVADSRRSVATLLYYTRDTGLPVYAWPPSGAPNDHFQLTRPLPANTPEPVLAVGSCEEPGPYEAQFASVEPAVQIDVPSGPTSSRRYALFTLQDRTTPPAPLGPCRP